MFDEWGRWQLTAEYMWNWMRASQSHSHTSVLLSPDHCHSKLLFNSICSVLNVYWNELWWLHCGFHFFCSQILSMCRVKIQNTTIGCGTLLFHCPEYLVWFSTFFIHYFLLLKVYPMLLISLLVFVTSIAQFKGEFWPGCTERWCQGNCCYRYCNVFSFKLWI